MSANRIFYRLSLSTLVAVYLLILVGGIVRSTGSGMGCPDWPKCFGAWIPPTSVSQLPDNYKEIYSEQRHQKNIRFANYLRGLGFKETAEKIVTDEAIREEADFNPVKTWIEYVNRLIGVVIGLLIFAVFVYSLRFWNTHRSWTVIAFSTFVLVGFQGWIGSIVVSTNLTPWTITVHMFLALVIVVFLVFLVHQARNSIWQFSIERGIFPWLIASIALVLIQILLGTQVREALDQIVSQGINRGSWIDSLGLSFIVHRSFSWVVLIIHAVLIAKLFKSGTVKGFALSILLLILGTILSGTGMAYFAVPAFLQPIHLMLASVTFGVEFLLALQVNTIPKTVLT
jgi:cytochrome c oxidase assembly protein subunit 15